MLTLPANLIKDSPCTLVSRSSTNELGRLRENLLKVGVGASLLVTVALRGVDSQQPQETQEHSFFVHRSS